MCKIQKNVQNYEKCAELREICKIQRNVRNYEKFAEFRKICKIQRNMQNSENHSKFREMCKIQKILDKFTIFNKVWYFWSKVWLLLTNEHQLEGSFEAERINLEVIASI